MIPSVVPDSPGDSTQQPPWTWTRTLSRCPGGRSSGVSTWTLTPSIVPASLLTCRRWSMAGMPSTVFAAILSAAARHSSPVFPRSCQIGLVGAPTNFCISGLMSAVGTGRVLAGTCSGAGAVSASAAAGQARRAARTSGTGLCGFTGVILHAWHSGDAAVIDGGAGGVALVSGPGDGGFVHAPCHLPPSPREVSDQAVSTGRAGSPG